MRIETMTNEFLTKNADTALVEIKEFLYERLRNRTNYAAQDPLKDPYYKGLQKGALSEVEFLKALLDIIERS
jgi:hypothetical protein